MLSREIRNPVLSRVQGKNRNQCRMAVRFQIFCEDSTSTTNLKDDWKALEMQSVHLLGSPSTSKQYQWILRRPHLRVVLALVLSIVLTLIEASVVSRSLHSPDFWRHASVTSCAPSSFWQAQYAMSPWRKVPPGSNGLAILGNVLQLKDKRCMFGKDCKRNFRTSNSIFADSCDTTS